MPLMTAWLFMSFVVERLTQIVLDLLPFLKGIDVIEVDIERIIAFVFSLIIAIGADFNLFAMFEIEYLFPYVGNILTALLMVGGSGLINDVTSWVADRS